MVKYSFEQKSSNDKYKGYAQIDTQKDFDAFQKDFARLI